MLNTGYIEVVSFLRRFIKSKKKWSRPSSFLKVYRGFFFSLYLSGGVVIERNGTNTNDIHYIEPPRSSYQDFQIGKWMHTFEEENTCVDLLEEVARKGPQQPLSPFGK